MGRARNSQGSWHDHAGSGRVRLRNGCDRGWSSCLATPGLGDRCSSDIWMSPKIFTGRPPFSEFMAPAISSKIIDGERPARPREAQGLGLTDSIWNMMVRCWDQDPAQRPTMREAVRILREWPVFSFSPWNQHRNVFPAATGWLLGGLESRIFRQRLSSTTFYPSVKPRMCFLWVVPTGSLPSSRAIITLQGRGWPERVAGISCTRN